MKEATHTVGQLRAFLADYPDDAPILCQVVGEETGAWNMQLHLAHGKDCSFKWNPQPLIVQMFHPNLKKLPMEEFECQP